MATPTPDVRSTTAAPPAKAPAAAPPSSTLSSLLKSIPGYAAQTNLR